MSDLYFARKKQLSNVLSSDARTSSVDPGSRVVSRAVSRAVSPINTIDVDPVSIPVPVVSMPSLSVVSLQEPLKVSKKLLYKEDLEQHLKKHAELNQALISFKNEFDAKISEMKLLIESSKIDNSKIDALSKDLNNNVAKLNLNIKDLSDQITNMATKTDLIHERVSTVELML